MIAKIKNFYEGQLVKVSFPKKNFTGPEKNFTGLILSLWDSLNITSERDKVWRVWNPDNNEIHILHNHWLTPLDKETVDVQ